MSAYKRLIFIVVTGAILLLTGCSEATHSTIYYGGYYDPYPHWGYGNDTTVIIDLPDKKPERPTRPPGINPPKGGRPKPSPKRR